MKGQLILNIKHHMQVKYFLSPLKFSSLINLQFFVDFQYLYTIHFHSLDIIEIFIHWYKELTKNYIHSTAKFWFIECLFS